MGCSKWHTSAPEASWRQGFDPCIPLLFDLYHYLEQNGCFGLVSEHAPGPSSQVLPGCRVRHPCYSKNLFVRPHFRTVFAISYDISHIFMSHGKRIHESWHARNESYRKWATSHIFMSHDTRIHESWHTYSWVMAHIFISPSHACLWVMARVYIESWHTYSWVMVHVLMSHGTRIHRVIAHHHGHGTRIHGSWHTYSWIMANESMSHGTHEISHFDDNESRQTYPWDTAHIFMSHGTHIHEWQ